MKSLLCAVGLGFLVCVPCLAVITGGSLAAFGGALVAFALSPVAQAAGVLVASDGLTAAGWYARQRRACPQCGIERTRGRAPELPRVALDRRRRCVVSSEETARWRPSTLS